MSYTTLWNFWVCEESPLPCQSVFRTPDDPVSTLRSSKNRHNSVLVWLDEGEEKEVGRDDPFTLTGSDVSPSLFYDFLSLLTQQELE